MVYYHLGTMQEFIRSFRVDTKETLPQFASPRAAFEYALQSILERNQDRMDIVTLAQDGDVDRMYAPYIGNTFHPDHVMHELSEFFTAHYDPTGLVKNINELPDKKESDHGYANSLWSSSTFWEVPIDHGLVVGVNQDYDKSGMVVSRQYFIGKPFEQRNLRIGQKIHRALVAGISHS